METNGDFYNFILKKFAENFFNPLTIDERNDSVQLTFICDSPKKLSINEINGVIQIREEDIVVSDYCLSENLDTNYLNASWENGYLNITIPRVIKNVRKNF